MLNDLNSQFMIKLYFKDFNNSVVIVPESIRPDGRREMAYPNGKGDWEVQTYDFKNIPKMEDFPLLEMPFEWAQALLESLGEKFTPKGPMATEQELKSTKYHLEDMRRLVFKDSEDDLIVREGGGS